MSAEEGAAGDNDVTSGQIAQPGCHGTDSEPRGTDQLHSAPAETTQITQMLPLPTRRTFQEGLSRIEKEAAGKLVRPGAAGRASAPTIKTTQCEQSPKV